MSLRAFHIFFITVCLLFFAGYSAWLIRHGASAAMTAAAVAGSAALLVYLSWLIFRRRKTP